MWFIHVIWNNPFLIFRLFAENADLCELASSQTSVWPLKRQSHDYQICKLTTLLSHPKGNGIIKEATQTQQVVICSSRLIV